MQSSALRKPEIMSPAGYWPQLQAAIEAGADAVYFGLKHFSARAKTGFSLDELPQVMRTLHARGVRGFITFNTLVFEHELLEAARTIAAIVEAGTDAMIVQDYGIVGLVRQIAPDMELHGSTQMSVTNVEGVELAKSFGIQRVNLARELSLDDVRTIVAKTDCEVEIFVHGALCVAYSGQCFSSEAWGGRSANRGQCAQACRLPYEMLVDGRIEPLGDARYLLSPGDLFALEQIPEILQIGVAAIKIEGRYKDANYTALTTRAYRQAVDEAWAGRSAAITPSQKLQLEQVYSRGLGPFFMAGTNHQLVVNGRAPRHRGVFMGRVERLEANHLMVEASDAHAIAPLKPGDGVVFDAADWRSPEEPEEGGRVYQVLPGLDGRLELRFGNGAIRFERIRAGDRIWRTDDPDLDRVARAYTQAAAPISRQPVVVQVTAIVGEPLVTEWSLVKRPQSSVIVKSTGPLSAAQNRGLSLELLREQFGRLGSTAYELADVTLNLQGTPFVPASELNRVRRSAVEQLQTLQNRARTGAVVHDPLDTVRFMLDHVTRSPAHEQPRAVGTPLPELHLLVRTPEQLDAALSSRPASITLDYLDLYGLRPSLDRVKASGIAARVATPRVSKPGEERILDFLLSLGCTIVVRSSGMLQALRERQHPTLVGDFSLNTANSLTAALYMGLGLARITPTHDLNGAQIGELARRIDRESIEVVAYQHLPVFHTEHCVFCRFLSTGTSYRDCGRPCERHRVELKDSSGRAHPVIADVGCRNTVFGAEAQEASCYIDDWLSVGIRHYRLEFAHESAQQVHAVVRAFDLTLNGSMTTQKLGDELRKFAPQGTTEGSLFVPNDYLQLPILQ
ncbi:MAG TPA: U32 family peptidase [Bryobacteraceae bacterium]|nr:U32 family peptidase [Bryobacteraceae bacterium]